MQALAPSVTLWTGRHPDHPTIVVDDFGVRYDGGDRADQVDPYFEVLRERWGGTPTGTPLYGVFDPEVQWRAADRLLCAHCEAQPDREPGSGMLWLLRADHDEHAWPADIRTTTPPICRDHAEMAIGRCSMLRHGHLAVRVPEVQQVGVLGTLYTDGGPGDADQLVMLTDSRLRFVLARYLVLELRGAVPDPDLTRPPALGEYA
ncbi:hypothetical protein [Streptomyces sp. NPDC001568]|uniref:hypothetical protein n=1 Tax=Streptomyces sp. NPDC001568 TaxID=3364588 RepID=UPI00368EFF01